MIAIDIDIHPELKILLRRSALALAVLMTIAWLFVLAMPLVFSYSFQISFVLFVSLFGYNAHRAMKLPRDQLCKIGKMALKIAAALLTAGLYWGSIHTEKLLDRWYTFETTNLSRSTEILTVVCGLSWAALLIWLSTGLATFIVCVSHSIRRFPLVVGSSFYGGVGNRKKADEGSARCLSLDKNNAPYRGLCYALFVGTGALAFLSSHLSDTVIGPDTDYAHEINQIVSELDFKPHSKCRNVRRGDRSLRIDEKTVIIARAETPGRFDEEKCEL